MSRSWMKPRLAAAVLFCLPGPAAAEPLYTIFNGPGCNESFYAFMHPQGVMATGMVVWIDVPQWRQLNDEAFRQQVFEAAFKESLAYCKARNIPAARAVVVMRAGQTNVLSGWTAADDRSWHITLDDVGKAIAQADAQEERKRRELAEQQTREQAARKAAEERQNAEATAAAEQAKVTADLIERAEREALERAKRHPADSFCLFSCDPTEENARNVVKNQLKAVLGTPAILFDFRKTNGVRSTLDGVAHYELYYEARLELPQGLLPKPKDIWGEIQVGGSGMMKAEELRSVMNLNAISTGKKWWDASSFAVTGTVSFQKTEKGWRGNDGKAY